MTELKIRKATFQHVEAELYGFQETQREIVRLKNEIINGRASTDENVGGGRSNLPGDPTGRTAILLTSHRRLEQMERVVNAIESLYGMMPEQKQKLVKLKYWTKPQRLTWDGIALELDVSRRTAMNWRDEVIKAIAEKIGWR